MGLTIKTLERVGLQCKNTGEIARTVGEVRTVGQSRRMSHAENWRRIGIGNLSVGTLCIIFQVLVTAFAYIYQGLFAWNFDAPLLAKSMTGIFTGLICLLLGYSQLDYAREIRSFTQADLTQRICSVKLFSCFLVLFGLLLLGISVYLISILCRWMDVSSEYDFFVRGPVTVCLVFNVALVILALCAICLALMGLLVVPEDNLRETL